MTQHILKATLTRGEVTPLVHARQDIETYLQAAERIKNFTVLKFGGARRRSGTLFRGAAKFADKKARFIPLTYSNTQAYLLEFGHLYARVWTPAGLVMSGVSPYEVVTPYTSDDVESLQAVAVNDVMFIAHENYAPTTLSRLADNNWVLATCEFRDGPYTAINENRDAVVTVTGSPTTGATVTFAWATGVSFTSNDVGRAVRVQFSGKWVWGFIASVVSSLSVTVLIESGVDADPTATPAVVAIATGATSRSWRLASISPNHPQLRPGVVEVADRRVIWGRTTAKPRGAFASMSDYTNRYSPSAQDGTVAANHGFAIDVLTGGADPIEWIKGAYSIEIGSKSGIRTLSPSDNGALSPLNLNVKLEVNSGANSCLPLQIGSDTIYAGRSGTRLHDMVYDYQVRSLTAPVISTLSEHLFTGGISQLAFQDSPDSILWSRTADGFLRGTTFEKYEKVVGFHDHDVSGFVEQVACMPNGTIDEPWMIVRRVIGGQTVRYVETLQQPFHNVEPSDAYFVDCGKKFSFASPVSFVEGMDHLEGAVVDICADGAAVPQAVVAGGKVTLPNGRTASKISVGLPIDARLKLLRTPSQSQDGTVFSRHARVVHLDVDVYETAGLAVISDRGAEDQLRFRHPADPMGAAPPLFTGSHRVPVDGSWSSESRVEFVCRQPLPCTIRGVLIAVDAEP